MELPIDSIIVGDRHRKDLGDVAGLARSIAEVGLLHPVVVTGNGTLVAGERRLAACRLLGWDSIPARTADSLATALDLLKAERDENTERKDFAPTEAVAVGVRLEELERPKAEERERAGVPCGNLPQGEVGKTRDAYLVAGLTRLYKETFLEEEGRASDPSRGSPPAAAFPVFQVPGSRLRLRPPVLLGQEGASPGSPRPSAGR